MGAGALDGDGNRVCGIAVELTLMADPGAFGLLELGNREV